MTVELNFNAAQTPADMGFDVVPKGVYNVVVDETEMKPTKDTLGSYLNVRFNILDGQFANRKLFHRFNLRNNNQQTVEIAYKQLSALSAACGVGYVQNSGQLHNIPLKVRVKIKPQEGQYDEQNEITKFFHINDPSANATAPTVGGAAPGGFAPPQPQAPQGFAPPQAPNGFAAPAPQHPQAQPQHTPQPQQPAPNFAPPAQPQLGFNPPPQGQAPAPAPAPQGFAPPPGGAPQAPQQPWATAPAPQQHAPQNPQPQAQQPAPPAHPAQTANPPWQR